MFHNQTRSSCISRDADGQLPVHIAASKGLRCNVVHLLRDDPDFVNKVNNLNQSLLLLATKNGFCDVVSYLLSKNADHELKDKSGLTAFDWAVKRSLPEVVKVFLGKNIWKEVLMQPYFFIGLYHYLVRGYNRRGIMVMRAKIFYVSNNPGT